MNMRELSKRLDEVFELVFTAIDARIDARLKDIANKMCPPAAKTQPVSRLKKTRRGGRIQFYRPAPRPRREGPIQLCPVPKCKNRAAPVFGMVCSQHKGIAKKTIAKYRAARRAKAK